MYDDDNLPSGVAPWQASDMGILPTDDRHIAIGKAQLYEGEQQLQAMRRQREADDAARSGTTQTWQPPLHGNWQGTGASAPRVAVARPVLSFDQLHDTRHLAQFIETRRHNAQFLGMSSTPNLALRTKISWAVFAVCLLIVVLGIKLPFISYRFAMVEYLLVRIPMALSFLYGCKLIADSRKKPVNQQESLFALEGRAMLDALEKNYDFKKERQAQSNLLGGYEVPALAMTPQFIQDFSHNYQARTGKSIAYHLYRFNAQCEKRWFLCPAGLDKEPKDGADYALVGLDSVSGYTS